MARLVEREERPKSAAKTVDANDNVKGFNGERHCRRQRLANLRTRKRAWTETD